MGAALVLLLVALGALAGGVLIGRYYVPDDRQLRRTARHSRAYMRALSHLIARDYDTVVAELRGVVEESVDDVEPYFALGAMFRARGEHERAIRVHQALAVRERDKRKNRQRAMYELGLDFRSAGMPRRATRAMEEVVLADPGHEQAMRVLAAVYEEQSRFNEAADLWARLGKQPESSNPDGVIAASTGGEREHHLLVAGAQVAVARDDLDSARQLLKAAGKFPETAHFHMASAELAAARGHHADAKARLTRALIAEPALAPHVVSALIAAERALGAGTDAGGGADSDAASDAASDAGVASRVVATLDAVELETGPRLELDLVRASLVPATDEASCARIATELGVRFPESLAARVAAARLAVVGGKPAEIQAALEVLVAEQGALAWTLRGRWQCATCGHHPSAFTWRCPQCRRWASLRIETGLEPPLLPSSSSSSSKARERRALPRSTAAAVGLLAAPAASSLPAPTLDPGLTADELARAATRRSVLDRVGGWFRR